MNILIFEQEIYLQQKIILRLQDEGHECVSLSTIDDFDGTAYDTILISLDIKRDDINFLVQSYPKSTIIFLGDCDEIIYKEYLGTNKVKDYVTKPFSIDELIRKINHYDEFNRLKTENETLEYYCNFLEKKDSSDENDIANLAEENFEAISNFNCILTIDNYIKQVIVSFQNKYSDTELSSRLGINRKTLWVKRNKLNI